MYGTFADFPVCDGFRLVPVVTFLAVMAVSPVRVVAALEADAPALPPRELVELHVEATLAGVEVAVTRCEGDR